MKPLHESTETKNKNTNKEREEVQSDLLHDFLDWLQKFRENLVDESTSTELWVNPEQGSQDTSKSSHELPMEPRAKVELGTCKHSVYTHFPKDPSCDICLKTKLTRASCRRRAGTVVPRAEHFGDMITADHKIFREESESQNNHRYAVVVQDLATQWIQSYPCKTKNFPGDPEEPNEVSWSRRGSLKSFTLTILWNLASLVRISPGIIARLHHTDRKQMVLLREQYSD